MNPRARILVVDDEPLIREFLNETLSRSGFLVEQAAAGEEAWQKIQSASGGYDVVFTDVKMPQMNGLELLRTVKAHNPDVSVVVLTGYGSIADAVAAIKLGAFDYLTKPCTPAQIEHAVQKALEFQRLVAENRQLRQELVSRYQYANIVGKSALMQKVFALVDTVASSRATVLITGESGTGKELVAHAIHYNSPRREGPFVKLNCAALPEGLIESELFGHERGAFTGAIRSARGRFERADGGTLLLDEISEMPLGLQAKLLRVLQEREFERVGSGDTIQVDVRIVATTNRNLSAVIREGKFREDLYFRLNVVNIPIPPLRDRLEDLPYLVNHFIRKYNEENGKKIEGISEKVLAVFSRYHWPGNVRELENYLERAVVLSPGPLLQPSDFPPEVTLGKITAPTDGVKIGMSLHDTEKLMILKTLESHAGNRTKAAEVLGISTRTLRNKLEEYGLKE